MKRVHSKIFSKSQNNRLLKTRCCFAIILVMSFFSFSCRFFGFDKTTVDGMIKEYNELFNAEKKEEVRIPQEIQMDDLLRPEYSIKKPNTGTISVISGYAKYEWSLYNSEDSLFYISPRDNYVEIDTSIMPAGEYKIVVTAIHAIGDRYIDSAKVIIYE